MGKSKKQIRNALAGFMVFWLSGVLFLFCCGTMQAKAADADFCPLAAKGKSHCNKAQAANDLPTFSNESENQKFDCCGFLPAIFDKTRKIEKHQHVAQPAAKIKVDLPKFSPVENNFVTVAEYRPPITKQHKIFIKNCIFRI